LLVLLGLFQAFERLFELLVDDPLAVSLLLSRQFQAGPGVEFLLLVLLSEHVGVVDQLHKRRDLGHHLRLHEIWVRGRRADQPVGRVLDVRAVVVKVVQEQLFAV